MLEVILFILYGVLVAMFALWAWRLRFAFTHFKPHKKLSRTAGAEELPSVTVCVPARNENHAMTECLERLVSSNYEKIEVIVLDDLSGDNTSVLIKSFAHVGVRFVEGSPLTEGWLGKNHALQELLEEASGTFVLFLDVDTRIEPDSIEKLVQYAVDEKALMVSVMPRRDDGLRGSVLFSPLRYFWEMLFHRKSSPATASNAWMIHRKTLVDKFQGFHSAKLAIQPESRFSAELMKTDHYRFMLGTADLGISYEKKWRSQLATSIRLLYPLLGAKVAHGLIALLDLLIIFAPVPVIVSGFFVGFGMHQLIAGVILLAFASLYGAYLMHVWRRGWLIGTILWPIIILQEAILLVLSLIQYARRSVTWKGRLVRVPRS